MAQTKPTYAKLKLVKNNEVKTITFNDFEIEVKQYLPINDKLQLISNVVNYSADENNFANPVKVDLYGNLEIIYAYTNISFTDKQKEDPAALFDAMLSSGLIEAVIDAIPADEYADLISWINECIESIYTYRNSVMGILDMVSADYSNLDLDASSIQQKLADPENMELLKGVLTKLG